MDTPSFVSSSSSSSGGCIIFFVSELILVVDGDLLLVFFDAVNHFDHNTLHIPQNYVRDEPALRVFQFPN